MVHAFRKKRANCNSWQILSDTNEISQIKNLAVDVKYDCREPASDQCNDLNTHCSCKCNHYRFKLNQRKPEVTKVNSRKLNKIV